MDLADRWTTNLGVGGQGSCRSLDDQPGSGRPGRPTWEREAELQVTYNFKVDGEQLTGTEESPAGVVIVDNGRVTGDAFSFKVTVDGNAYPHAGRIAADACELDIDFGGQKVHSTLGRSPSQ